MANWTRGHLAFGCPPTAVPRWWIHFVEGSAMRRFAVVVTIGVVVEAIPQSLGAQDHAPPATHDLKAPYLRPSPFPT